MNLLWAVLSDAYGQPMISFFSKYDFADQDATYPALAKSTGMNVVE